MAGNVNTAPTAIGRLATKFTSLICAPRSNKETGSTLRDIVRLTLGTSAAAQTSQLANFLNGSAAAGLSVGVKAITDASATALFDVACASGARCGGILFATIEAFDGTDHQAMSVVATYAAVNKAGALTLTITDLSTVDAKAVSAGTLTLAWTFVTGTGKGTVKLQPTGSLTETLFQVTFVVVPTVGAVTLV